jgi:CubicO group peptidase (beta-lactamase class C family)
MPHLETLIEEELDRFRVNGAAVAVVREGEIILAGGFGYRDVEQKLPVTEQTLFPIGSTTKAFTASVIGTLVDKGVLEWDRPVREYLPSFELSDPVATKELTLRDMLSHRSGLPRHDKLMLMYGAGGITRAELVERLRHLQFNKSFREAWQYNNLIYMAAGYLIEVVAGLTWEKAVEERLLKPLGMANTNLSMAELQKSDDHSLPYSEMNGEIVEVPYRSVEIIGPAGSINSCIADMARWLRLNTDPGGTEEGSIISETALKEIYSPAIPLAGDAVPWEEVNLVGYGLGWVVEDFRGHRLIWHNGGLDGFKTYMAFLPKQKAGVVVLSNKFPSYAPEGIAYRVMEQLLGLDPVPWGERYRELEQIAEAGTQEARAFRRSKAKSSPPSHPLGDFAGTYTHPGYGRISFAVDEGQLVPDLHDLRVTMEHRHFNVWVVQEQLLDESIPFHFISDIDGEIAKVEARLEPTVDPIVFEKEPDPRMSDPQFLQRLAGTYEFASWNLDVKLAGDTLKATSPVLGSFALVPRLGLRFVAKDQLDMRFEFVLGEDGTAKEVVVDAVGVFTRAKETA